MPESVPTHLALARTQIGKFEDGPTILPLAAKIAELYPDMAGYCRLVTPTTSWCGLFCGHDLAVSGVRPPYNPKVDTQSFLWARSWLGFGTPIQPGQAQPGDILIFDFGGGDSHVTFHNGESGANFLCLGGNQSDQVKVSPYPKSQCIGVRRPPPPSSQPQPLPSADDPSFRPLLRLGAMGPDVSELQRLLGGIEVDGEFGPATDAAVRAYQASHGLEVDGEVGPQTWSSLLGKTQATAAMVSGGTLTQAAIDQIVSLARSSPLARHAWKDRGVAPIGYIDGLAVTFARVYLKLKAGDSAALAMTVPIGDPSTDALAFYGLTGGDRPTILRRLFALLYGLGMRESSGNCFEGRDQSANNVRADSAEAGLFQQSWDSHSASVELPKLLATYSAKPDGLLPIFNEGVPGSASPDVGSGEGAKFQNLCKSCPAFAVEAAAVGLRAIRKHWGPINRREAEFLPEAEQLLLQVQGIAEQVPVVAPVDPLAEILRRLKLLENIMTGTTLPTAPTTTTPTATLPPFDIARLEQEIARLGQIAATFSQLAGSLSHLPTAGLPPQFAQLEQAIARLGQLAGTLSQFATGVSGQAPAATATAPAAGATTPPPQLSAIDKLLGGEALVGLKTPLAIGAYALMWILQAAGVMGTATGDTATTTGSVLTALVSAFGALGVTSKFDRAFKAISTISTVLQKLPAVPVLPIPKP